MPSSTSSSEHQPSWRPLWVGLVVCALAALLARGTVAWIGHARAGDDPWTTRRFDRFLEQVPAMGPDGHAAVFFGSSRVELGFSPRVFDEEMARRGRTFTTYDFGAGIWGFQAQTQRLLVDRIARELTARGGRLGFVAVELVPFHLTKRYRAASLAASEKLVARFATPRTFVEAARASPERAARLFVDRVLLGGTAPDAVTAYLDDRLGETPSWWHEPPRAPAPLSREYGAVMRDLAKARPATLPPEDDDVFTTYWRGGRDPRDWAPDDVWQRFVALNTRPEHMEPDVKKRVTCCDVFDLDLDDALIDDYLAYVRVFQTLTDHVFIVRLPDNRAWVTPSALGKARLDALVARVEKESGVPLLDYSADPAFTTADFNDATHLTRKAAGRFSRLLASALDEKLPPK